MTFGKDKTICPMYLRYFPFDKHTCQIEFMEVALPGINSTQGDYIREGVEFQKFPAHADQPPYVQNGDWEFLSVHLDTSPRITRTGDATITYAICTVTVELQRKPSFYFMTLMVPSVLISLISVIGFLLPSESGEKTSLQLTALLSCSLLLTVLVDIVPPIGGNFPLIGKLQLHELVINILYPCDRFINDKFIFGPEFASANWVVSINCRANINWCSGLYNL